MHQMYIYVAATFPLANHNAISGAIKIEKWISVSEKTATKTYQENLKMAYWKH